MRASWPSAACCSSACCGSRCPGNAANHCVRSVSWATLAPGEQIYEGEGSVLSLPGTYDGSRHDRIANESVGLCRHWYGCLKIERLPRGASVDIPVGHASRNYQRSDIDLQDL